MLPDPTTGDDYDAPSRPPEELWCCHVLGPDDLYAAPDQQTAHVWADQMNGYIARRLSDQGDVLCRAEAALWPWSADAHAGAVLKAVLDMTTPGVIAALARANAPSADGGQDA